MKSLLSHSNLLMMFQIMMDLNFTLSPSPSKKVRPGSSVVSPLVTHSPLKSPGDSVSHAARDLLSGALHDAIKKDEDDEMPSDIDSLPSPMKKLMASGMPGMSPLSTPSKSPRKRKRKAEDVSAGYEDRFVMKLFDRSVDLAQFKDDSRDIYPLYPVARAWIKNEPLNLNQAPRDRSPTPEPGDESSETDVYKLPAPQPLAAGVTSMRIPDTPRPTLTCDLDLELDTEHGQASAPVLLSNHLVRWWGVKKSWKHAAAQNEKRFTNSLNVIKDMFENRE